MTTAAMHILTLPRNNDSSMSQTPSGPYLRSESVMGSPGLSGRDVPGDRHVQHRRALRTPDASAIRTDHSALQPLERLRRIRSDRATGSDVLK